MAREAERWQMRKHFEVVIEDRKLHWQRREQRLRAEARLDGVYAIRTSLSNIPPDRAVRAYQSLSRVKRAFRSAQSILKIRPMYVYTADHVRGHVFLCMLAYFIEWNMRQRLAPLLFEDDVPPSTPITGGSPVDATTVSDRARQQYATRKTEEGHTMHSFRSLLDDLSTLTLNQISLSGRHQATLPMRSNPTPLQNRAFELLEVDPQRLVPSADAGSAKKNQKTIVIV